MQYPNGLNKLSEHSNFYLFEHCQLQKLTIAQNSVMFTLRLWRRIHRPFLFIVFTWSSLLLLTKVSIVSTVVTPYDATNNPRTLSGSQIEASIMNKIGNRDDQFQDPDDVSIEAAGDAEDLAPIPVVHQLPFCGDKKKTRVKRSTSGENTFAQHFPTHGQNESDSSEEVVLRKLGRHIIVATLDGRVSLLDSGGRILWSVCTGHLFSSTISSLQLSDRGKFIKLIPSLTGGLYKYDGISLQAMPMNADSLLQRSFKLAQDVVITGGKEFRTFGIDIDSGLVKYECGIAGCSPTTPEAAVSSSEDTSGIVLVIKKTLQTVRAIDSVTGIERWNFSVGTHELALAGVSDGCYEGADDPDEIRDYAPQKFRMIIPEGLILGTNEKKEVEWKHKFDSPISQAWILEDTNLRIMDPIKAHGLLEGPPSLYVGMHRQQLYVQESQSTSKKLMDLMALEESNRSDLSAEPLQISWRPTTSILTPTAAMTVDERTDSTALVPLHTAPFFVYDRDAVTIVPSSTPPAIEVPPTTCPPTTTEEMDEIEEVNVNGEESVDARVIMAVATLWFWWKEILGISLLTAVILNVILLRPVVYLTRRRTVAEVVHQVNLFLRRNRHHQQLALPAPGMEERSTSNETLEASSPSTKLRLRTSSTSSGISNHSDDQLVPFVSQYLKEFEPVQYIGKGAFGTVFEAKKKIDDRSYAVKRIALPNREKSRDRVMREVKALARLDHKNIVRYFNAWIENPPFGWLEKNDPLWNALALNSPSPTCDNYTSSYACDYQQLSRSSFPMSSVARKDHSEIFVLDTPDEDSFIVFEQESNRDASYSLGSALPSSCSKRIPQDIIEESENGSDWSPQDSGVLNLPASLAPPDISETSSKFFRRPTTLDIPSSPGSTELLPSESEVAGELSPTSSVMYLYIQQELCQKRTLQDWLRGEPTRRLNEVMSLFWQLVEAVEYIHANKLIHRDLKPGNIFLAGGSGSPESEMMTVKIGDFGLATTLAGDGVGASFDGKDIENPLSAKPYAKLTGQVGTQLYMAPEQALRKAYDHKVDIYSLGLIFFELLVPLSTDMEKHTELNKLRQMRFPSHFIKSHPEQFELIQDMVSHDPNSRPDASEIKSYLSKSQLHVHGSLRSRSYPDHLMNPSIPMRKRAKDKDRVLYKTHSAM